MTTTPCESAVNQYTTAPEPHELLRRPQLRAGTFRDEAWSKRHLLSLDGGGIRGYWTLLVLEKLMEAIATEEERQRSSDQEDRCDSFWPEKFPEEIRGRHVPYTELHYSDKFLPCHYFDIICGSSTGALIAILLSCFRTTVANCRKEYEDLSHKIFGKPRWLSQRTAIIVPWPKYSAKKMEKVLKDVTHRSCEDSAWRNNVYTPPSFPTIQDTCATLVTTLKRTKNEQGIDVETSYLIRSHDIPRSTKTAEKMELWAVARAATAAPMYFKELKIFLRQKEERPKVKAYFTDGGFGVTNNPAKVGFEELKALSGSETTENVGVVVSVGTARGKENPGGKSFHARMRKMASTATDPGVVAKFMKDQKLKQYWRFNDDETGLHVELDEWKPNSWFTKKTGHETLTKIENAFYKWAHKKENFHAIEACAKELVVQRRRRTVDRSRWQRFATGATKYKCGHGHCEPEWNSLYQFEEHWEQMHSRNSDGDQWKEPTFDTWTYQKPNGRHASGRR